jgi:pimeloyl-ACP methyl ester carboxylesterase
MNSQRRTITKSPLLRIWGAWVMLTGILWIPAVPAFGAEVPFSVEVTGSGKPMILIPGLSCGGNVWDGTVAHFKNRHECHVLTLAGFAGQPAIEGPFLETVRAGVVKYIRDKKLDHPVLIGHSLGGMLSYWIAATAPDALGPVIVVDGLPNYAAVIAPGQTPDQIKAFAASLRAKYTQQGADEFASSNRRFIAAMITSPQDVDRIAVVAGKSDPKTVGQAFEELMITDLRPQLKAIKAPVLLLGSTAMGTDPASVTQLESMYRSQVADIPVHQVKFVANAKHFIQLDQPEAFYRDVEAFVKNPSAAGPAAAR